MNSSLTAVPKALFPLPVAPYRRTPRGSFIGMDLKRNAYFIGFSIMLLIVFFAVESPASLVKSKICVEIVFLGLVSAMACLLKAAKVSDSVF